MTPEQAREALATRRSQVRAKKLSPAERKARVQASGVAVAAARRALVALHPDEWQALYQTALADALAERGLS